jgi:hypothetical protein
VGIRFQQGPFTLPIPSVLFLPSGVLEQPSTLAPACSVCCLAFRAALPPETHALGSWQTLCPLLVMGSHVWNSKNAFGEVMCGEEVQAKILQGASRRAGGKGAGAMLLVLQVRVFQPCLQANVRLFVGEREGGEREGGREGQDKNKQQGYGCA